MCSISVFIIGFTILSNVIGHSKLPSKSESDAFQYTRIGNSWTIGVDGIILQRIIFKENYFKASSCYKAKYLSHTKYLCYPSVIVAGFPKCGTSALFSMFSRHSQFYATKSKEECLRSTDVISVWSYISELSSLTLNGLEYFKYTKFQGEERIVSGCINFRFNMIAKQVFRDPQTVYVYMIRSFPSYLWSLYNYWCHPEYDRGHCDNEHWADPSIHYRSPGMFHELIIAKREERSVYSPLDGILWNVTDNHFFQKRIARYEKGLLGNTSSPTFPPSRIIYLANEELILDPSKIWVRLSQFMCQSNDVQSRDGCLALMQEDQTGMQYITGNWINTNDRKGASTTTSALTENYTVGKYRISNFEPMWSSTQAVLDLSWRDDCLWVSKLTAFAYSNCHLSSSSSSFSLPTALPSHFPAATEAIPLKSSGFKLKHKSRAGRLQYEKYKLSKNVNYTT